MLPRWNWEQSQSNAVDNPCKGSQETDPDVAWSAQLQGKVLETTAQSLSWVLGAALPHRHSLTPVTFHFPLRSEQDHRT